MKRKFCLKASTVLFGNSFVETLAHPKWWATNLPLNHVYPSLLNLSAKTSGSHRPTATVLFISIKNCLFLFYITDAHQVSSYNEHWLLNGIKQTEETLNWTEILLWKQTCPLNTHDLSSEAVLCLVIMSNHQRSSSGSTRTVAKTAG